MRTRHLIVEAYLHVLAFAMFGMGAISLLGYLQIDQPTRHNVILLPDSAIMAMLMGGLILAATRQAMGALKLLAGLLFALCLYSLLHNQLAGGEDMGRSWLSGFLRMRSLLASIMLLATLGLCLSGGPPLARRGAQLSGGLIMLLAVLAQLADSLPALPPLSLGFKYGVTQVANLFTLCLGLAIILLGVRPRAERGLLDRRTLAVGLLASLLACSSWYLLSRQAIQSIDRDSQLLLAKVESASAQDLQQHLALLQRLAERWQSLGSLPPASFWQQEAHSYLRDFPNLELLAVLDRDLEPHWLEARTPEQADWLRQFLADGAQHAWLLQAQAAPRPQLSQTRQYAQGSARNALLASALRLPGQAPVLLVASLNIQAELTSLLSGELHGFAVQAHEGDSLLYDSGLPASHVAPPVSQRSMLLPHGQTWRLSAYGDDPQLLHADKYLASLTLLFGLVLSFFLLLSQRLAWLATQHAQQLQRANQHLEESLGLQLRTQALNQRIMQFTLDVLCSIDRRGCFHEISPSCEKLFGYPAHELLERPFIDLVLAEDRPRTREDIGASMQAHASYGFRNRCRHRDGRVLHILWSADWSEQEQTLFAVAHDITPLVKNEAYAETQREILSMISNDRPLAEILEALCLMVETLQPGALCSVLLLDASATHLHTGAAPSLPPAYSQAIDGISIGPTAGSCGSAAFNRQLVISEDIASDPLWQELRALALSHGLRACWSFPLLAHDGQGLGTFAIYYRHPHVPDDEQIQHLATAAQLAALGIARGAERRRLEESQQRFRSLFTCNPDPVFSCDLDGHFRSINAASLHLLGLGEDEILGQHFTSLIADSQHARIREHFAAVCGGTPQRFEVRLQARQQPAPTLDVSMLPIMVDAQIVGVFGIAKDVSEHQRMTSELHQALIRAQHLTRQLRGLSRAALVTGKLRDSQALIDYLAAQTRESVAAHQCSLHLCASGEAANLDGVSLSDKYADWRKRLPPAAGSAIYDLVCASNQPLLLSQAELQAHPRWPDFQLHGVSHPPLRGWLAVPLIDKHGANLGILQLSDKYHGEFDMADLALAQQFAQMAASVLEGNRLLNAVLAGEQRLKAQLEFTATVTDSMVEGLLAVNTQGQLSFINPAAQALVSASEQALLGRPLEQLLPINPSAWQLPDPSGDGDGERGEFCLLDGSPRTLLYEAHPMFAGASHSGWVIALRDISAQRRADQAQRERDRLFNLSLEMLCMIDLQGHFIQVNPAFAQTLHYPAEALIGQSYSQLIHQEDLAQIEAAIRQLQDGAPIKDLQIRAWDAEAHLHWLQFSAALGEDRLVYCAARDITEQRASAEQIQQSNLLLSMAGSSAKLGGWALELPEKRLIWSAEVCNLLDYPAGRVPALEEGFALYPSAARPLIQQAVRACAEDGTGFDLELPIHTRNGRLIDARITAQPVRDPRAGITRMIGAIQDISEHKQALREAQRLGERLRATLESISDAFYTLDSAWHFTYVNPAAERLLQAQAGDLLGRDLWSAFPGSYTSEIGQRYRQALESDQASHFESFYEPLERWFELHVYPSEEGLAVYFQDISERRQTQQELQATLLELERSNQELQEFAFVASHDLQEPLRKIQAFSERLANHAPELDAEGRDYLQRMTSAAARMQALIIDLLNYSRVNSRGQPLQRQDLNQLLGEVLVDMETVLEQTQAKVEYPPLPAVLGDASQLRQVLQNLLSNALKFQAPGNPPLIRLSVEQQDSGGWTLCIADNGIGFEEKYLDRIFTPFQRLHGREAYPGTGIGLAIVKKIVERHGARIDASSQVGQGSTFRISFPALAKEPE